MKIRNHGNLLVPEYVADQIAPQKYIIAGGSERITEVAGCYFAFETVWAPIYDLPHDFVYVPVVERSGTRREQILNLLLTDFDRVLLLEPERGLGIRDRVYRSKTLSYNPALENVAFNSVWRPPAFIAEAVEGLRRELHSLLHRE